LLKIVVLNHTRHRRHTR